MPMGAGWRGFTYAQAVAISVTLWLATLALVFRVEQDTWRVGLEVGVAAAAISGVVGFVLHGLSNGRSFNVVLASRLLAIMFRFSLLAVTTVFTIKLLHSEPLGFVMTFFPLFFVSVALEQFIASHDAETPTAADHAAGGPR
jgi:hypothetical protein